MKDREYCWTLNVAKWRQLIAALRFIMMCHIVIKQFVFCCSCITGPKGTAATCVCVAGYVGNGTHCKGKNVNTHTHTTTHTHLQTHTHPIQMLNNKSGLMIFFFLRAGYVQLV